MRKLSIFLLVATATLALSCSNREIVVENRAVVSIAPLKPIIEGLLGDDFEVTVLVPQGTSPETFEPTPKQLREVESARFVFGTGLLEFEKELLDKVARNEQIVDLSQGITLIAGSCSHAHHDGKCGHNHGIDPHIWCSPRSLVKMTQNAYKAISAAMPDSTKYMMAYNNLYMEVANLNKEVSDKCAESKKKSFMIYHPALSYFARDYHLTQIAIENEGKEPSAKHLARIIEKARKEEIKHILYQSEFPASSVAVICEDTGATAVEINPLSEDIFATLRHITTLITE